MKNTKLSKRMYKIKEQKDFPLETLEDFFKVIKNNSTAKFTESIDIAIQLGINAKKSDENVRGNFNLIHGIPKNPKIIAFVTPAEEDSIKNLGISKFGLESIVEEVRKNKKIESYDYCFASTAAFPKILPIAQTLGKNGLMPNKKDGTVADNISEAIANCQKGTKCMFRNDSAGYLHFSIGKSNMTEAQLVENIKTAINYIQSIKPEKVKTMILNVFVSSSMGMSLNVPLKMLN